MQRRVGEGSPQVLDVDVRVTGAAPLFAEPVYGLRTWVIDAQRGAERLVAPQRGTPWPAGGVALEATCPCGADHAAPAAGCVCGLHAWHPTRAAARRVCSVRREVPGIMEGTGAVEVHAEGFRAQRARPVALVLLPNRNAPQLERVAAAYDAELLRLDGPAALLDHCRSHGLGLADAVVADLLGPGELTRERRVGRRHAALAAAAIAAVLLAVGGLGLALDPGTEHGKVLHGRSGDVRVP